MKILGKIPELKEKSAKATRRWEKGFDGLRPGFIPANPYQ
jgi:hypothetical protein